MRFHALSLVLAFLLAAASAGAAGWPLNVEALMAADAASYAPPDFKRMLARHRDRLMAGVKDAAATESAGRGSEERMKAAARGARGIAKAIRDHKSFSDIAYMVGGLVHEVASGTVPPGPEAPQGARFLGYTADPFADPEKLVATPLPKGTSREAYDTSVTVSTRLLAWIWKTAGGDAGIATRYPESKGPYVVRE